MKTPIPISFQKCLHFHTAAAQPLDFTCWGIHQVESRFLCRKVWTRFGRPKSSSYELTKHITEQVFFWIFSWKMWTYVYQSCFISDIWSLCFWIQNAVSSLCVPFCSNTHGSRCFWSFEWMVAFFGRSGSYLFKNTKFSNWSCFVECSQSFLFKIFTIFDVDSVFRWNSGTDLVNIL